MKRWLLLCLLCCPAQAAPLGQAEPMEQAVLDLQEHWAQLQYLTPDEEARESGFADLAVRAEALAVAHPESAAPLIWEGIARASQAQNHTDTEGLRLAEQSRDLLLRAVAIDPDALGGAAIITLGALYYKVPGWPISFGDADIARDYLQKAIAANPDCADAHYFYGDFLYQNKHYAEAAAELQKAIDAPAQPGSSLADAHRRDDARELLAKVRRRL